MVVLDAGGDRQVFAVELVIGGCHDCPPRWTTRACRGPSTASDRFRDGLAADRPAALALEPRLGIEHLPAAAGQRAAADADRRQAVAGDLELDALRSGRATAPADRRRPAPRPAPPRPPRAPKTQVPLVANMEALDPRDGKAGCVPLCEMDRQDTSTAVVSGEWRVASGESRPSSVVRRPSPVVRRPSPVVRRPSPVARRPSPVVRRPSPVVRRPSPVARRPSSVLRRRCGTVALGGRLGYHTPPWLRSTTIVTCCRWP